MLRIFVTFFAQLICCTFLRY